MISEETKVMIKLINRNKETLKGIHHFFDEDNLLIAGIGYESIKVLKENREVEYYRYSQDRGKRLCVSLANIVQQKTLL